METGQEKCSFCDKPCSVYTINPGPPRLVICKGCKVPSDVRNLSTFPFTTSNLTGQPVTVNSLRQLRSLESQFGVQSHAYNFEQKNFNDAPRR